MRGEPDPIDAERHAVSLVLLDRDESAIEELIPDADWLIERLSVLVVRAAESLRAASRPVDARRILDALRQNGDLDDEVQWPQIQLAEAILDETFDAGTPRYGPQPWPPTPRCGRGKELVR